MWAYINYHVSVTLYKRSYDAQVARNRSTLGSALAPSAFNRDIMVCLYTAHTFVSEQDNHLIVVDDVSAHQVCHFNSLAPGRS